MERQSSLNAIGICSAGGILAIILSILALSVFGCVFVFLFSFGFYQSLTFYHVPMRTCVQVATTLFGFHF